MKMIFLEFECNRKLKPSKNTCIVRIIPGTEPVIENIGFKEPLYNMSYDQLLGLNEQIENTIIEFTDKPIESGLVVAGKTPSLLSILKNPNSAKNMAEKIALELDAKGKFSADDKKLVSGAFDLINKLFAPRKK